MFPILNLGPLALPVPEFVLLIGVWAGSVIADRKSRTILPDSGFVDRLIWSALAAGIVGARLSYIARNPAAFSGNYLSFFSLNQHLFDFAGGGLIALSVSIYVVSRSKIPLLTALDSISPFFAVFLASLHLSKFARGVGYGTATDLPWGINLWGLSRHPVQIYYFLASLIVLGLILYLGSKYSYTHGIVFFVFALLSSLYLLLFSRFEVPDLTILTGFRINQIVYWAASLISLVFINKHLESDKNP